jgi:hypothetical protein
MIPKDGSLGSIFAGRASYRSATAFELWSPEERKRYPAQAQYAGVEDTARYLGVPLQEFSELELENIKQAWVGVHPRCGEPFAPSPGMTPTILGPAFAGAGEEAEAAAEGEAQPISTPTLTGRSDRAPALSPNSSAVKQSATLSSREMRDKLEIQSKSREATADLTRLAYQYRLTAAAAREALKVTVELPELQDLPAELAIVMARLVREQAQAAQVIVSAIIELRAGGQSWVETALTELSAGVLDRTIADLISQGQVKLGAYSVAEAAYGVIPLGNMAAVVLQRHFTPTSPGPLPLPASWPGCSHSRLV